MDNQPKPGPVILFGSGETSPSGRKVFEAVLKRLPHAPRLALLETPAGFELNSAQVIGRVGEFIRHRLQNYQPEVTIIPARKRGTPFSPDVEQVVSPILESDMIFMGPGSPSYAVRQLRDSLAWDYILARHGLGAALVLASSAVVAISAYALPVYEIYKVGEDPYWKDGLDFFGNFGLPLVFVPHWNNHDGGEELDTSRCFMGKPRFSILMDMLPKDVTVVGIDEKTALFMDLQAGECHVIGLGGVTLIHTGHEHTGPSPDLAGTSLDRVAEQRQGHVHIYGQGETFPLHECCPVELRSTAADPPSGAWEQALLAQERIDHERLKTQTGSPVHVEVAEASAEIMAIVDEREQARRRKDWKSADVLRDRIAALGWKVIDTPDGPRLLREQS